MRLRSALASVTLVAASCVFQPGAPQPITDEDAAVPPSSPDLATHPDLAIHPDLAQPDLTLPPDLLTLPDLASTGRWYQADKAHCTDFCAKMKLSSVASPDGATCMSGEARAASGIQAGIRFSFGCRPDCSAQAPYTSFTVVEILSGDGYCYKTGQVWNFNQTDLTVGCFCR